MECLIHVRLPYTYVVIEGYIWYFSYSTGVADIFDHQSGLFAPSFVKVGIL